MADLCMVGYTYRGYEMAQAFERADEFGYSGIEVRDFCDIDLSARAGVADVLGRAFKLADQYGLAVHSLFYAPLPVSRTAERAAEERAFCQVIEVLAGFHVPILHTRLSLHMVRGQREVVAACATEEDYAAIQATLRRVVPVAEERRVTIALETHMGTIHDTAASQLRIVTECASPYLTASLDFANMLIAFRDEAVADVPAAFGPHIGYIHLKNVKLLPAGYDWNLPLRWGDINYYRVLQALKKAGYRGPLAVEYCGTGDPDVFAEDDARYLQELAERVGCERERLARKGTGIMIYHRESLITELEERARELRVDSIEMIYRRQAGHPGGCLSAAEIMAVLFFHELRLDSQRPDWPERDRFILSKGHASAILYAALPQRGFFPLDDLIQWGDLACHLQGHPDRIKTPGVEMTTGVLGHGLAIGTGLALAARLNKLRYRTFVLLGDGECQGGIVWEGAMAAAKYRLANLTAIIDYNDVQLDGPVHEIMPLEPLVDKFRAFNWATLVVNGHDVRQLLEALDAAREVHDRPLVIVAHTTKGKGVSFMENDARWHGIAPGEADYARAMAELKGEVRQ